MDDYEPSRITELSPRTVVLLLVFVPGLVLIALIWLSYTFAPWT